MPLFWKQPHLSWGIDLSVDQMHVIALRDSAPQPELCHEFSLPAPNAYNLPAHLNNPMAMGKSLAEVLRRRGVGQGQCCIAIPDVRIEQMHMPKQAPWEHVVQTQLPAAVAEPWAFDYVTQDGACSVAYCPQSLVKDFSLLAAYTPLQLKALEPEASALERAVHQFFPACLAQPWVVLLMTPRGCLWQAYTADGMRYSAHEPWRIAAEALPYAGWSNLQEDLRRGYAGLRQTAFPAATFGVLLAGEWALEPELQALVQAVLAQPITLADPMQQLGRAQGGQASPVLPSSAHYMLAFGLALRGCQYAAL